MAHENEEKTEPTDKLSLGWQVLTVEEENEYITDD